MNRTRLVAFSSAAVSALLSQGQLVINNDQTAEELVNDVLLGAGVTATNITFNGDPGNLTNEQAGTFNGTNTFLGLESGVILATGSVNFATGPNDMGSGAEGGGNWDSTDVDLVTLSGFALNDAAVLEFDFVPNGDSLKFEFIFASDEYPEFACSSFNDVFGFFLSGPGITGPFTNNAMNIALIPNTTVPIAINTVNVGQAGTSGDPATCDDADPSWQANSVYYVANGDGSQEPFYSDDHYVQYDGYTVVLTARAEVVCGQTYHIKLAVADAGDTGYDSAVFLKEGSFASVPFIPSLQPGPGIVGDTLYESCFPVELTFVRLSDPAGSDTVDLIIGGTATAGLDYSPTLPTQVIFEPGVMEIPIAMTADIDTDGDETIVISIIVESPCSDEVFTEDFEFWIKRAPPLIAIGSAAVIDCGDSTLLTPTVSGGYGLYEYQWPGGQTGSSVWITPTQDSDVLVQVTDACGVAGEAYFAVGLTPPPALTLSLIGPDELREGCDSGELLINRPNGYLGDVPINFSFSGAATHPSDYTVDEPVVIPDGQNSITAVVHTFSDAQAEGPESFIITATYSANACNQVSSATVDGTLIDSAPIQVATEDLVAECTGDSIPMEAIATGGVGTLLYNWTTGDNGPIAYANGEYDSEYYVTVTDECGTAVVGSVFVNVLCDFIIPNVFTPNGDGKNDAWVIRGIQASPNSVRVFDRWGTQVFSANNYANNWSAKNLSDGTYFYEVIVNGEDKPYTGHLTILSNDRR
jgi:gliding motility-associated-like protein